MPQNPSSFPNLTLFRSPLHQSGGTDSVKARPRCVLKQQKKEGSETNERKYIHSPFVSSEDPAPFSLEGPLPSKPHPTLATLFCQNQSALISVRGGIWEASDIQNPYGQIHNDGGGHPVWLDGSSFATILQFSSPSLIDHSHSLISSPLPGRAGYIFTFFFNKNTPRIPPTPSPCSPPVSSSP